MLEVKGAEYQQFHVSQLNLKHHFVEISFSQFFFSVIQKPMHLDHLLASGPK